MSFASETKNELSHIEVERKCCQLAEIAGFFRVASSIKPMGGGKFELLAETKNPAVARHFKKLIQDYFDIETQLQVQENNYFDKGYNYYIVIGPDNKSELIMRETGILMVKEGYNTFSDGISSAIVKKKCCKKAFLRGIFLGVGSVNDPESSYNIEFVCNTKVIAEDLRKLIRTFTDLNANIAERKGKYVVYMKSFANVSDTLAIMGAHRQVLEIENIKIQKEMKTRATKIVNCDNANIDKSAAVSDRQIDIIKAIDKDCGIDAMPLILREIARLRLENPDANLTQLGQMLEPPIQRSAVHKRMSKIEKFAENRGIEI
ncbi:MAG: DNA-binding protein WhiA [Clostridia bacterium]|nr:DNA-binding protein WhiA [Clostridia bacterium]